MMVAAATRPLRLGIGMAPGTYASRRWSALGGGFIVLGGAAQLTSAFAGEEDWSIHGVWCVAGLCLMLPTLVATLRNGFEFVLTDHRAMFVCAFALYFLFGALLLSVGPVDQAQTSLVNYPINAREALRVDAMNGIGLGVALVVSALSRGQRLGRHARRAASLAAQISPMAAMGLLLVVGASASLAVLPVDLGLRDSIVGGWLRSAGHLPLAAVLVASAARGRGESLLRLGAAVLAMAQFAAGLLLFNKSAAMLPIAALVAGLAWRFGSRRILPGGLLAMIAAFTVIAGPTAYARNTLESQGGTIIDARWAALMDSLSESWHRNPQAEYPTWVRLCHVPSQAAALDFYDNGDGGDDLRLVPWLVVPRLLAPEKPIMTQTSVDFNQKITGSDSSSTGMGVFVSGYYNAGWLGMILTAALVGWLLANTSAVAAAIVSQRGLLMMPVGLLGVYMAFRIDGHVVADYLGSFVLVVLLTVAPSLLARMKL
jgi:hypothetical protein